MNKSQKNHDNSLQNLFSLQVFVFQILDSIETS